MRHNNNVFNNKEKVFEMVVLCQEIQFSIYRRVYLGLCVCVCVCVCHISDEL